MVCALFLPYSWISPNVEKIDGLNQYRSHTHWQGVCGLIARQKQTTETNTYVQIPPMYY